MAYSLRSLVVFSLFFFSSVSLSFSSEAEKVSLVLYYETLCPYCSRFIVNGLTKVFEKDLYKIVDLKLVPYGNAKIDGVGNIACQHGEYECLLNTVEACAISVWPDLNEHFPFIYCVESLVMDGKQKEWQSCFGKLSYDSKPIEQCYKSGLGQKLELQYANETINLEPPHTYVPWVVVNGQPLYDDYWSFIDVVCKAYKGTNLPKACTEPSLKIIPTAEENGNPQVTYIDGKSQASTTIEPAKLRTKASSYRRQMMSVSA